MNVYVFDFRNKKIYNVFFKCGPKIFDSNISIKNFQGPKKII